MTNVIFDLVDVVGEVRPGDTVRIWPPRVTRNPGGQTVVTRPETVNVGAGPATRDISPGPLWVQIQAGGYTDTEPKLVRVPEVGEFPDDVTIANLLARVEHYDPVLESWAYENARRAEQAALEAIAARDRSESGAELSKDAAAVSVAAALGFEGHSPEQVIDAAARAEEVRAEVVPLADQVRTDATSTAANRKHVDGQVEAIDTAFTESVPPYLQPAALTRDRLLGSPHVDARVEGLWGVTTSKEDVAPILNAAANRARAERRPLYIPAPKSYIAGGDGTSAYSIFQTVDLRFLDVYCEANIIVRHADSPGIIVGDDANLRNGRTIRLGNVKHENTGYFDWDWPYPAVRVIGFMNGQFRISNSSLLELSVDGSNRRDRAIAYSSFDLQRVNYLRLQGINGGWINENTFHGGSYNRITVEGDYSHSENTWYKPSMEGSHVLFDFQCGYGNSVQEARTEGGARVRFSKRANRNILTSLYLGNMDVIHETFKVEEDLGEENIVTTVVSQNHTPHTLFCLSPETFLTDTASSLVRVTKGTAAPIPTLPAGKIRLPGNWTPWIDTGLIPLESKTVRGVANVNKSMSPDNRITRFNLTCDQQALRTNVFFYDSQGRLIRSDEVESMRLYAGWAVSGSSGGYYTVNYIYGLPIVVTNPDAKFMRIEVTSGGLPVDRRLVEHVTLTAYAQEGTVPTTVSRMIDAIHRPVFGTAMPTSGLAWPGTTIAGRSGSWRSVARVDTSVKSVMSPTELALGSSSGIAPGDVIGVLMDDGGAHWTTVESVSGATVTISTAPSGTVTVGAAVGTTRWVYIPDVSPAAP